MADPTARASSEPVLAGRYRLEAVLGRGGMGEVHRGFDVKLRRRVAIKLLTLSPNVEESTAKIRVTRLLREARAAASLTHPNVVAIYDVGDEADPFIVMELVEGASLAARLAAGNYPSAAQALDWLEQVASALASAHRIGIVHRDIKPDNLLVDREGRVKIADFGIVKALDLPTPEAQTVSTTAPELTGLGKMVGTPRYMAPEQLRGEAVDGRTDQYSWALVAYELLTATHAYDATPTLTTPQMVANGYFLPASLAERAPEVPRGVDELLLRCLAAEPQDRVRDMSAVHDALVNARRAPPQPDAHREEETPTETTAVEATEAQAEPPRAADNAPRGARGLPGVATLATPVDRVHPSRPRRWPFVVPVVVVLGVAAFGAVKARSGAAGGGASAAPPAAPTPTLVLPVTDTPPAVASLPTANDSVASVATAPPSAPPAPSQRKLGAAPRPRAPAAPAGSKACESKYTVDSNGVKHFKAECF